MKIIVFRICQLHFFPDGVQEHQQDGKATSKY